MPSFQLELLEPGFIIHVPLLTCATSSMLTADILVTTDNHKKTK
jgi:hypothetical protein